MREERGAHDRVLTLGRVKAARGTHFSAFLVLLGLAGMAIFGGAEVHQQAPALPGVLPAFAALVFLADALTAYLLWGQARAGNEPALVVLVGSYLGTAVLVTVNAWLFPAAFLITGAAHGNGSGWAWVFWHILFALGTFGYAVYPRQDGLGDREFRRASRLILGLFTGLVLGAVYAVRSGVLPPLMGRGPHFHLPRFLFDVLPPLMILPGVALAWRRRGQTVLDTWLFVAMVGMWLDAWLMRQGGGRYAVGWYAAHAVSLMAALAVLAACLFEVNRLYRRLVLRHADMSEANASLRAENDELSAIAEQDDLTQLLNRRAILQHLRSRFEAYRTTHVPVSVLMIDLDHFKTINDVAGHLAGDDVLAQVGMRLRAVVRAADLVGRYGGEEFLVVLAGTGLAGAEVAGHKILEAIRGLSFVFAGQEMTITASIGAACATPDDVGPDTLVARADQALYAAKRAGRDRQMTAGAETGDADPTTCRS